MLLHLYGVEPRLFKITTFCYILIFKVSWLLEHIDSSAQTFDVVLLDEDKLAEYKKVFCFIFTTTLKFVFFKAVQSGNENPLSNVEPLFTAQYYHSGVSKKTPLSSEGVCLIIAVAAVYYALNFKQELSKRD
jgi:hypothetical protein